MTLLPHLRHVATLPWEIKNQIFCRCGKKTQKKCIFAFLIGSNLVIHPQTLIIFGV